MNGRNGVYRLPTVLLLLVVLHFTLRPWLGEPRPAPDFLLLALLVYAIRARPGAAAIAGFIVGLLSDALTPVAFGAGALAHTVVGYLAAWGKAIFFAENLAVNAGFFFAGTWVRDLLVLVGGGHVEGMGLVWQLLLWSPLKAASTALVGVIVLVIFRRWLAIRIAE
ncbi:MAG TPA: rod shape-determining protein MreD [Gemmatimonadales bacterium]|jgi:rod shape-determining protein MreD|nr:rod shape-determining protein MreD [Gemmatimonadales bacterium]